MELNSGSQKHIDSIYCKRKVYGTERILGRGWLSVGGEDLTKDYFSKLSLEPGSKVLDAGCGTGGCAFFMARYYGLIVHGVDLSKSVIDIAKERLPREDDEVKDKVHFEVADISQIDIEDDTYDVIYCRSVIVFVANKERLFKKMHRWLKPGGTLFFTDFCLGKDGKHSDAFCDLVQRRGYHPRALEDYRHMIQEAGFKDEEVTEATEDFVGTMHKDLRHFESVKKAFIKDFSKQEYDDLLKWRKDMIKVFSFKDLVYAVVYTRK